MKHTMLGVWVYVLLLLVLLAVLVSGCGPVPPTAVPTGPFLKMNPPPDSDKSGTVPNDNSCYAHAAANLLAAAGYGNGTTVQDRADDIWNDMSAHYGANGGTGGWIDSAIHWWLASPNNTWTANPYTLVTVYGNKTPTPWANSNGARDIGNYLRACDMVGLSITWDLGGGQYQGHAISGWGDDNTSIAPLTANPGGVTVTDSDTDSGGDVQSYTYDAYNNGWYFNYGSPHPFIKHIAVLEPLGGWSGSHPVRVTGSYQILQNSEKSATDLHYWVGTDVDILSYRTWTDWATGTPTIVEDSPRRGLTVDWDLANQTVPQNKWVTISTEFVEPSWNSISYKDVHFTYPDKGYLLPDLTWEMKTPLFEEAEKISNATGGHVIGSFDLAAVEQPDEPVAHYRFVHQYLYNQSPELHTLLIHGTKGFVVSNVWVGHSYGYPTVEELWKFENWMTQDERAYELNEEQAIEIPIDWRGRLPYPAGDLGAGQ